MPLTRDGRALRAGLHPCPSAASRAGARPPAAPGAVPGAAPRAGLRFGAAVGALALFSVAGCTCGEEPGTDAAEPGPPCSNTFDDDLDGLVDFPIDPGCLDPTDEDEADPPIPPICADGLDNDGDALIDYGIDPGCAAASDPSEDEVRECNDAVDNDADAIIDFPFDPGCTAPGDDDETDPPPPDCADGEDDDLDLLPDYPLDPGCLDADDDDETDPDPLPDCANGADDDGDALTDYPDDPDCLAASDDSELTVLIGPCGPGEEIQELPPEGDVVMGFFGGGTDFSGSCGGLGGETLFHFALVTAGDIRVTTNHPETTLDSVVYIRTTCLDTATELGCNDETDPAGDPGNHASTVFLTAAPPGDYYVFVDSFAPSSTGTFRLTVDRVIALGDPCDPADGLQVCEAGTVCRAVVPGGVLSCELPVCGNALDDDGDAVVDYPADPGCLDAFDPTETDPTVPPACANGADDDADALTDWPADPGCLAASDGLEVETCGATAVPVYDLDLAGSASGTETSLAAGIDNGTCGGFGGDERVLAFHLDADADTLTVGTDPETTLSIALYLRSECNVTATQVACDAGFFGDGPDLATGPLAAGDYYLFVDEAFGGAMGDWAVHLSALLSLGQPCDPGHLWQRCASGTLCADDAPGPDWTCRVAACADGLDSEPAPDGLADYPADPGCDEPSDDDEADPATPPACANAADDDGDGRIDWPADPGCLAASSGDEGEECGPSEVPVEVTTPVATAPGMEYVFLGFTPTGPSLFAGTCGGATAPESVYMIEVVADATSLHAYTVMTGGGAFNDTVLYVRSGNCLTGPQVACNDDTVAFYSNVLVSPVPAGFYFVFVDGYSALQFGDYELHLELTP